MKQTPIKRYSNELVRVLDAALATELPLSARVEAKIARECFANEPGPTQGTSPLQRQENKGEIDG